MLLSRISGFCEIYLKSERRYGCHLKECGMKAEWLKADLTFSKALNYVRSGSACRYLGVYTM